MKPFAFIFEDVYKIRMNYAQILNGFGFEVRDAGNYDGAIEVLRDMERLNIPPSIALLDIRQDSELNIPKELDANKTGFYIADTVCEKFPGTPIIFRTGYSSDYEKEAEKYQPFAFLDKSKTSEDDLRNKIEEVLVKRSDIRYNAPPSKSRENERFVLKLNANGNLLFRFIDIRDILYFHPESDSTHIRLKSIGTPVVTGIPCHVFKDQLTNLLSRSTFESLFFEAYRAKYAGINHVLSFDKNYAYFDEEQKIKVQLSPAGFSVLLNNNAIFMTKSN